MTDLQKEVIDLIVKLTHDRVHLSLDSAQEIIDLVKGRPNWKTYSIWSEGYVCTGDRAGAHFICTAEGKDFKDACSRAYRQKKFEGHGNFDPDIPSLWGCRLFDNQSDASRSFG